MRFTWLRLGIPIALLLGGAMIAGILAWREAERAHTTAQVLMKDYASFIADKFVQLSANRYLSIAGISSRVADDGSPFALLRATAQSYATGRPGKLPRPEQPFVEYLFITDTTNGALETSGQTPSDKEMRTLDELVFGLKTRCSPNSVFPMGRLASLWDAKERSAAAAIPWSGLIETDPRGAVRRIYGLRLNLRSSLDRFLTPLITNSDDCDCGTSLLPASLSKYRDSREAAFFVLRDGERRVVYASQPQYGGAAAVTQALSPELPFAGWTIEVTINPAVVQPFLPYGGRGVSWCVLALVGCIIPASGILAFAALRGESRLFRLRQDFISSVSHELRTPLARIRLFNELLMGGGQTDEAKRSHYRKVIDRECRRLTILIGNILDFSRHERGVRKYQKTALDLRKVVEDALESFRAASDEGRFKLSTDLEPVGFVMGDAQALEQVLINLLDNAVKYSPEGSSIEITLACVDRTARLRVADHGCGISLREQHRIFEPFYRVGSHVGREGAATGSGLGLALVRRAVEDHGGRVFVHSRPGEGSTFEIAFPLCGAEEQGP
jgi:signal transduction histidine kinase